MADQTNRNRFLIVGAAALVLVIVLYAAFGGGGGAPVDVAPTEPSVQQPG